MNILDTIGQTPLVKLKSLSPEGGAAVYAKLEGNNPAGSVKDRAAFNMILTALKNGDISKKDHLVEATSGNTGIALAMIASQFGIKITLVMPDNATTERISCMRAYGANLVLTPAKKTIEYARLVALEMRDSGAYVMLNQFANPNNYLAHYHGTGPEIWRDTKGEITHFVSAMGTTGTIMGVSRYLKNQNDEVQIIGAQPKEGDTIPGIRRWSADLTPEIYDPKWVDSLETVSRQEAIEHARLLAREEGIFCGMSTGGACTLALRLAKSLQGGIVVFIACDRGDRYLSTELFKEEN